MPGLPHVAGQPRVQTAAVRAVLVHELLHALEDQHFGLDRPDLGDEAFLGFQALAEGSAVRVEEQVGR